MVIPWANPGLDLHLDLAAGGRRAALERALKAAVQEGRLEAGALLPPSRALAADLGIARNTVTEAYAQLVAEGWLVARQGSGTRVSDRVPAAGPAPEPTAGHGRRFRYDLMPGQPDLSSFPSGSWLAAMRRGLATTPMADLGYGDPRGVPRVRETLAAYLARVRGVRTDPDHLVLCAGFEHGLALVARAVAARGGRTAGVEAFSRDTFRAAWHAAGLRTRPLAVDGAGAAVDDLPTTGLEAVLLTPAHQFPLGTVLAPHRRQALAAWAEATGALVVEDDYDGEFRYDRRPVGALQPLAPDRVVYTGTASKALIPGLRLGWLAVPDDLLGAVVDAIEASGARPSAVDQLALADMITSGAYDRHVRRSRLAYRRRRDRLVEAISERVPDARISGVAAGLQLLLTLPAGRTEEQVIARAAGRGLAVQGLHAYATGGQDHPPALVVGYAAPAEHAFTGALARLVAALV